MIDPYIYENGTLRNKLGIQDYSTLKKAEADIGFVKLINIESVEKSKNEIELIKRIHKHIFEDIFEWAGEFRNVPLYKTEKYVIPGLSLNYSEPKKIDGSLKESIRSLNNINWKNPNLDELIMEFTKCIVKIWKVHPFRDGNTRTILSFACMYAAEHGLPMDKTVFLNKLSRGQTNDGRTTYSVRDYFVYASLEPENYAEPQYLANLMKRAVISERKKETKIEK